jgi:hypothetical protein
MKKLLLVLLMCFCVTTASYGQDFFVDIKPESCPNPINTKSGGVLPVSIVGTNEFNPATDLDLATINILGVEPLSIIVEDVATPFADDLDLTTCESCIEEGADGIDDLSLKFSKKDVIEALLGVFEEVENGQCILLEVQAESDDGTGTLIGEDVVRILLPGQGMGKPEMPPGQAKKIE